MTPLAPIRRRRHAAGLSLVELMISVTIGLLIILGATRIYAVSSKSYAVHETAARLEEGGRYALSVIEPDVRMAGNWGLVKGATSVTGGSSQASGTTNASGTYGTAVSACGLNFGVDLSTAVEGTHDSYLAGAGSGCLAKTTAMPGADTLTVRHASVAQSKLTGTGPLRICSDGVAGLLQNALTSCPVKLITTATGATVAAGINDLVVNTYYIDQSSPTTTGLPTLYRQTLVSTANGTAPTVLNVPILPGVEDLQVQFGIDPTGTTGSASQYVDAVTASTLYAGGTSARAQVVAVRIWLLLRADTPETGFVDTNTYQYADRQTANGTTATLKAANAGLAYAPADHYRRLLIARTIMLRNALGT
jgi:type IV pilus assembly protein PilW